MPASAATIIVAATVVAPVARRAATTSGRSRRLTFATLRAVARQALDFVPCESGLQASFDDRDGRGHAAFVAYIGFELQRGLDVVRPRHAVADDGRLERDHRLPRMQRGSDLVGKIERKRQYLTEQPYGVVLATVTGLPASVSVERRAHVVVRGLRGRIRARCACRRSRRRRRSCPRDR